MATQGFLTLPDGHPAIMDQELTTTQKLDVEEEKKKKNSFRTYSSEETSSGSDSFCPYYCFACGSFAMAVEGKLHTLPRRKTDAATVVEAKKRLKHRLKEGECKTIKREGGVEKQYRWVCGCGVPIAYQSTEWSEEDCPYTYVLDGSLCCNPSVVSLYWREEGTILPECFQEEEGEGGAPAKLLIPLEIIPDQKKFNVKMLEEKMTVEVSSSMIGGDMKEVNSETLKSLIKVLGLSKQQVKLDSAAIVVHITGLSSRDALRRILCSMM